MPRQMCVECPHRREHEVGDETMIVTNLGEEPQDFKKPHPCHMVMTRPCVGSEMQLEKWGILPPKE